MNDPWELRSSHWLRTALPFGSTTRMSSLPIRHPWDDSWLRTIAATWDSSTMPIPPARPPIFPSALPSGWPQAAAPREEDLRSTGYREPAQVASGAIGGTARIFPDPSGPSYTSTPARNVSAEGFSPAEEAALAEEARRAAAERMRRALQRPAPAPPSDSWGEGAAPLQHVDLFRDRGAVPPALGTNDRPPVDGMYLGPVPRAPRWEQVVPPAASASAPALPKLPGPFSWGSPDPGMECYTSGGNLTCTTPGGRRFTVPAEGLPDDLKIAPGHPDYHYYNVPVGPRLRKQRSYTSGIVNDPTPGLMRTVRPATEQGTENPAAPWKAQLLFASIPLLRLIGSPSWPVRSYKTVDQNGVPVVVNVTQPGHPLYPGVVMRYEAASPSGPSIQNEGTGLGWWQGPESYIPQFARDWANDYVWRSQSRDIMKGSRRHWPKGRGLPLE